MGSIDDQQVKISSRVADDLVAADSHNRWGNIGAGLAIQVAPGLGSLTVIDLGSFVVGESEGRPGV